MTISGKYFPSQENEEKVFLLIRKHWFNYLVFVLLAILMLLPVVLLFIYWSYNPDIFAGFTGDVVIVILAAYLLALLGIELYGVVNYYLDVYIVTDRRIVDITQDGFFKRKISELHLKQIQDVSAKVDGVFQTLLHFGDVYIQTAAERENFIFQSIPHPYSIAKEIISLHENFVGKNKQSSTGQTGGQGNPEVGPDRGLSYEDIEAKAKQILKDSAASMQIKSQGYFTASDQNTVSASTALPQSQENITASQAPVASEVPKNPEVSDRLVEPSEGTLEENKEVDIN